MQYFKRTCRTALAVLGLAGAMPVLAIGTDAGTPVTNSVSLNYSVNGGAQPALSHAVTFVVDRALAVDVTATDIQFVGVTIGQDPTVVGGVPAANYTVTNTSNTTSDLVLRLLDRDALPVTGFTTPAGVVFNEATLILARDTNTNQRYDEGVDTPLIPDGNGIYTLPGVVEDATVALVLAVQVPGTAAAADYATYTLVAAVATAGVALATDDSGNASPGQAGVTNPNTLLGQESVFLDGGSGSTEDVRYDFFTFALVAGADVANNGQNSDSSGFVVRGVNVLVAKYAEVLYDPISGNRYDGGGAATTNQPKAIPGAVVLYVVGVRNNDGSFVAQGLQITDDIPDTGLLLTEPVDEGNPGAAAVNLPASVTFDLDTGPGTTNGTFSMASVTDLDQIHRFNCAGVGADLAYAAGTQVGPDVTFPLTEVDVAFGDCTAGQEGFIAYFVTVETVN